MSVKSANKKPTMADEADIHELYELSVQNVENEVEFLQSTFQSLTGRTGYLFREDFCGTASASCQWVRQGAAFQAIGVDIDPSVLEWGREHRVGQLDAEDRARVSLIESDVMSVDTPKVDLLAAFNFSFFIFDTRDKLRAYFERAYEALKDDGVFFCDLFGGPEAQEETREKTKHKKHGFTYIWHQAKFHPVTNFIRCHIHFKFKDGSKIKRPLRTSGDSGRRPRFASCCSRPVSARRPSTGKVRMRTETVTAFFYRTKRAKPISRGSRTLLPRNSSIVSRLG
jgi:SAM-dependent methyltransferase